MSIGNRQGKNLKNKGQKHVQRHFLVILINISCLLWINLLLENKMSFKR